MSVDGLEEALTAASLAYDAPMTDRRSFPQPLHVVDRRPRKVALFGLFGIGNLGNDATLAVALDHFSARHPTMEITCICAAIPEIAQSYGVRHLPLDPLPPKGMWRVPSAKLRQAYAATLWGAGGAIRRHRARSLLADFDELIVLGTGVLDDYGARPWDLPGWLLLWCEAAHALRIPVNFLGVGAGPIVNGWNRRIMKRAIQLATSRSYRDEDSKRYLAGIGVDTGKDEVIPDLVFALPDRWVPRAVLRASPQSVGVGVMTYQGWQNRQRRGRHLYDAYIAKMSRFVAEVLTRGFSVRLLIGEVQSDGRAVTDLVRGVADLTDADRATHLSHAAITTPLHLLAEIAATDVVVASRYHNVVSAFSIGRPTIALGYGSKFEPMMASMGMSRFYQTIERLELDRLRDQFDAMLAARETLSQSIVHRFAAMRKQLDGVFDSALKFPVSSVM